MTATELKAKKAAETVAWVHDELALGYREIGAAVDANERTVRRWEGRTAVPQPRHQEKLRSFQELRHLLQTVFESKAEADEWMHSPLPTFRGHSPLAVIANGRLRDVIEVLATIESGAYL